jgi:hypothetical protein
MGEKRQLLQLSREWDLLIAIKMKNCQAGNPSYNKITPYLLFPHMRENNGKG